MRVASLLTLVLVSLSLAAEPFEFWPGARYDSSIPTVKQVLGYEAGQRIAPPADLVLYFEALAKAAPTRVRIVDYGKTWEGRRLIYAIIASEENLKRVDEIKASMLKLADSRKTTPDQAKTLAANLPAVVDLSYGVHGNEISSPDAALMTAYHVLAAQGDPVVDKIRKDVVLLIDPSENPDGRNRFVHNFTVNEGLEPDGSPVAAERVEPWPGGRTNHYYFDLNRDWVAVTQPETRGRIAYLNQWLPLVLVDLHEMGTESTYYFAPGAQPYNPHLTKEQIAEAQLFGKNNAKWFDQFGYRYFTREVYDEFYPGYGESWPWYYGGFGMTYENASVRGLLAERQDGTLYVYQDSVRKHFITSISTCEVAADHRAELLDAFYKYNQSAVEEGKREAVKEYILARRGDVSAVDKLARLLAFQGIEVRQSTAAFSNAGKQYPAGSYTVIAAQPRKRFIRTLLDPETKMDAAFVREQERRLKRKLRDQIYDVTAWSLPLTYNVECVSAGEVSQGSFQPLAADSQPAVAAPGTAQIAYLVPWGTQAAGRFLTAALRADLKVLSAGKAFTQDGRKLPSGTLVVLVRENGSGVHQKVAQIAGASGAEVIAVNSSWVDDGVNFGSGNVALMKKVRIGLLWDTPTASSAAGNLRFVLERQYGYPVGVIRVSSLGAADLSKYQVLIFPDSANYSSTVAGGALEALKVWVRNGGVLIGIGDAVTFLSSAPAGLLNAQEENLVRDSEGKPADVAKPAPAAKPVEATKPAAATTATASARPAGAPGGAAPAGAPAASGPVAGKLLRTEDDFEKATRPEKEQPKTVAGALLRAKVDQEIWINAGLPESLNVLFEGRTIYSPVTDDHGVNAVIFDGPDKVLASGVVWDETRKQLAYKPFVIVQTAGKGAVIGFTSDPTFRGLMDGLNVLFLNAVFRSPALNGRAAGAE